MIAYLATLYQRLADAPWYARVAGFLGAAFNLVVGDPLTGALGLLVAASGVDWLLGRERAHREHRFDKTRSAQGWQVKAGTIAVVLIIRGIEAWLVSLPDSIAVNTHGAVSAGMAMMIVVDELDSIDENIRGLGGTGIPGLRAILEWLRSLTGRWLPGPVRAQQEEE